MSDDVSDDLINDLEASLAAVRAAKRASIARNPTSINAKVVSISARNANKVDEVAGRADLEHADRPGQHVEHVYCVRYGSGPVKFGYSANVGARLRVLGASHWEPITILGAIVGDRRVESDIHELFSVDRIEKTEWFRPSEAVIRFAERMAARQVLPEVQKSIDMYAPMPIEHVYAGTRGQGRCPCCGR